MKTLVILAHPDVEGNSISNNIIINMLKKEPATHVWDLYKAYPDFKFDIRSEQKALADADLIIFQFPFYWYGMPGMLKEWLDRVFVAGFAYAPDGSKLKGKTLLVSTTVGGNLAAYAEGGVINVKVEDFLMPLEKLAMYTGLKYHTPLITYGHSCDKTNSKHVEQVASNASKHANKLLQLIKEETTAIMSASSL